MNLLSPHFLALTLILGLVSLTLTAASINGQQRSREEILRDAGRLVTEAERKKGEAYKQVQAGADRKLLLDADKLIAESLEKAIELWREVRHDNRLRAGVEELTRIYSVIGEYDRVVARLTREAEYWQERGDVSAQADTLFTLGIRQLQMKRDNASIETLQQVLELSRSAGLRSLEPNVLTQLASLYEKAGRVKEAESARESANKLWSMPITTAPRMPDRIPPATIPAQWVDLPGAPAAAEYRVIAGVSEAVLVNRSSRGIGAVAFGCVALEDNKKVRVLYGLGGEGLTHGGVRPGSYYQPLARLNGPLNRWTDEKMGCEGAAKMTLIEAMFDDGSTWKADGIDWTP
jgi:tetratricopeptide (TPR) repeat protein